MDTLSDDEEEWDWETRNGISSSASYNSSENSSERELSREISRRMPGARPKTINEFDDSDFLQESTTPENLAAGDIRWLYNRQTGAINIFSKMVEKTKRYEQKLVLPVDGSLRNSEQSIGFHLHRNIFDQAFQQLTHHPDLDLSFSSAHAAYFSNNERVYLHNGRYRNEFEEIRTIGRGGFAKVMEVLHKVDKQRYAVKRIPIKSPGSITLEKLSQEVTILAKLTKSPSPRIVRYHAAWLEEEYISRNQQSKQQVPVNPVIPNLPSSPSSSSEEEDPDKSNSSIVFEDTSDTQVGSSTKVSSSVFFSSHTSSLASQTVTQLPGSIHLYEKEEEVARGKANGVRLAEKSKQRMLERESYRREIATAVTVRRTRRRHSSQPMTRYILYIQMELCGTTLSEWLQHRNEKRPQNSGQFDCVNHKNNIHILRQILEGVSFVHDQDILHRDLKPLNVFLKEPHLNVKIGDFGLAREVICIEEDDLSATSTKSFMRQLSTDIGTSPYIAPEQQQGGDYDSKADMYSFGIIKYEMFHPFQTGHERISCIKKLRDKGDISDHLHKSWPEEAQMIQKLTSVDKVKRPSASEVLNASCYCMKGEQFCQTKMNLQRQLSDRDHLIKEKEKELAAKSKELEERVMAAEENERLIQAKERIILENERKLQEQDKRMRELEERVRMMQLNDLVNDKR